MKPSWLAVAAILYCSNLLLLLFLPPYARFWADWGIQAANSGFPWRWASAGELLRFLLIAVCVAIYWLFVDSEPKPASNSRLTDNRFIQATASTFALGRGAYDDTLHALNGMDGRKRLQMIKSRENTLPYGLTVDQIEDLIGPLKGRDRVNAIKTLASHLAPGSTTSRLLEKLKGNDRVEANTHLHI